MATIKPVVLACQAPNRPFADTCQVPDDLLPAYWPGGGISLLAGAPNAGKTAWVAGLLRDFLAGRPIFGLPPRVVPVGYINADRGWAKGAGQWLQRAGVDVPFYSLADDPSFSPKRLRRKWERVDVLCSFIDKLGLPRDSAVVVDPISLFLGGNLLDYDSCACAALEIRAYLKLKALTLFGLAHSGKLKADKGDRYLRTTDQILGSTAISGFADAILYLAIPAELDKPYYSLTWHPHGAKPMTHYLDRDEDTGLFLPYAALDTETQRRVLQLFPQPPETTTVQRLSELADRIPLSRATVKRVLAALLELGYVEKPEYGVYRLVNSVQ